MTWLPFVALSAGIALGLADRGRRIGPAVDQVTNAALVALMIVIGVGVGADRAVMAALPRIGVQAVAIALAAIAGSVAATVLVERSLVPMAAIARRLTDAGVTLRPPAQAGRSPLLWLMPAGIAVGVLLGWLRPDLAERTDTALTLTLIVLYVSVGVGTGANRAVFAFLRLLGARVVWLSVAIAVGSVAGGYAMSLLLGLPHQVPVVAAGGMSFYSVTGAFMTDALGTEYGSYGFVVNIAREMLTVALLPLLARISRGSAIAGGAAGCMDTMLAPVTQAVGAEVGLVALVTGTLLTLAVPVLLPILLTLTV